MTSRERMLAALRCAEVDHTPCSPVFWTGAPLNHAWQFRGREGQLDFIIDKLGADAALTVNVPLPLPPYKSNVEHQPGERYDLLRTELQTPKGPLIAMIRKTEDYPDEHAPLTSDWCVSRFVKPWIETMEDAEKFASVYVPPGDAEFRRLRETVENTKKLADRRQIAVVGEQGQSLGALIQLAGAEQGVLLAVDEPGIIDVVVDAMHRSHERKMEMLLSLGVTTIRRNGWYDSTDFWSPRQFARWVVPHLRSDVEKTHQAGGLFIYQMCTGMGPLLPQLAQVPFDCLLEAEPALGSIPMRELKHALPGKSFWGGVSAPVDLECGSVDGVRQAVRRAFHEVGNTGLILKAVPSIRAHLPRENVDAFFDEWKKLR